MIIEESNRAKTKGIKDKKRQDKIDHGHTSAEKFKLVKFADATPSVST